MYKAKGRGGPPQRTSILSALKATEMLGSKPTLPAAEILVAILDYLPVSDLMRVARCSWRMQEMVYDDTRWVARLKSMGCWDEAEARQHFENAMRKRREAAEQAKAAARRPGAGPNDANARPAGDMTIFDASVEEDRQKRMFELDGFEKLSLAPPQPASDPFKDPQALLDVIKNSRSIRGHARQNMARSTALWGRSYQDLARARSHTDPVFFELLLKKANEQTSIMERIFPEAETSFWELIEKIRDDIILEYSTSLFDAAHQRSLGAYLKAVSGVFEQTMLFFQSLTPPKPSKETIETKAREMTIRVFEPHVDLYLQEELDFFTKHAESEVGTWEKRLSEQDASVESFYMSNINRQVDKTDFLSSFKKVVMMPVSVLPSFQAPFGSGAKPSTATPANGSGLNTPQLCRPETPGVGGSTSLGRAAQFIRLKGQYGEEAREQCETIFVVLLRILGTKHVQVGFEKAVGHLSNYNPREVSHHDQSGVAPLVQFIELVNVGDLISQMIDVFYEQQLAGPKIADKNDFLDPAGLAKRKWEQMLDENVAAGLNKGIDVLMDEVEFLHGSTQLPTDYNPQLDAASGILADPGPTATAQRIVELVSAHTRMLVGSTDKSMLDVFNGEVGLRLFTAVCKHLKRQRVSTAGAIKLIADMNLYFEYIRTLRNQDLLAYFKALRELSQIYLIEPQHAKEMATIIADGDRFGGIFRAEEVYEYAQRRADWYQVKTKVERAISMMKPTKLKNGIGEGAGETEIGELDVAVGGDEQVVGLDVAVQDKVLVAEPDGAAEHAHPGLDVGGAVAHIVRVLDEHLEVAEGQVLEHEVEVLVLGGKDGEQRDDVGVLELLEMLELADGVGGHALAVFLLDLDLLDGHEGGGVGSQAAEEDDGIGTLAELLALDVFSLLLLVHLLGEIEGRGQRDGLGGLGGLVVVAARGLRRGARRGLVGRGILAR
ncbi:F-box protein pof6 [Verticillium dahliae VdLs.17]|uniref:F-box protein pof6 n=1 Tax=Verticillium dahliae (strain VdLs.17 / ATCC MYA-4575 / FGSC 10137) TaxID=498257 RepID=G2WUD3_VERDV|nr:F-box protein pof6 [Verticillium dahliae VdLs.17]EGY17724.1 F-box protein pof6 [Verticillium dahliae VdLs.17]